MVASFLARSQDSTAVDRVIAFPDKIFSFLDKKASKVERGLSRQTEKYLAKLEKQETKLKKKLLKKDSALAKELFPEGLKEKYQQLRGLTSTPRGYGVNYSGHLDSLTTAFRFLGVGGSASNPQLQQALEQFKGLQAKLDATTQVRSFLLQRENLLRQRLRNFGMLKQLKSLQKQVYYYQAQVRAYKEMFDDPSKLEARLLQFVTERPEFQDFFSKHSSFSAFFPNSGNVDPNQMVNGLQTRAQVMQFVSASLGNDPGGSRFIQQSIQSAQGQVTPSLEMLLLKNKSFVNSEMGTALPDFKPNSQKTKPFLKRLELGTNIQTQRSTLFFPVTTDLAVSAGYKVNDKSVVGLGVSYKFGLGQGFRDLRFTHEGIGFRSFVDLKLKGDLFISGGFEYNHQKPFLSLQQAYDLDDWQKSGLIGLSKIVALKSKFFKKTRMQLLWDFLSFQQMPRGKAIKFRVGYNF